jgi:cob(I)alamin adenosyltransferase
VDAFRVLLDASLDFETLDQVKTIILKDPRVISISGLWGRNSGQYKFIEADITIKARNLEKAHQGLKAFQNAMETGTYDMIILDEINVTIDYGLLNLEDVLEIVQNKSPGLHLILTGRNAKEPLFAMADLVTEMRQIKHHYQRGVSAQIGIEM